MLDTKRADGEIKSNLEAKVTLEQTMFDSLNISAEDLADYIVVSKIDSGNKASAEALINTNVKCTRSWKYVPESEAVKIDDETYVTKRDAIALEANKQARDAA